MKTIILKKPGEFHLCETPEPEKLKSGEALIRVRKVGICGTDIHAYAGRQPFFEYPRILGHELGAEVLEVAPDVKNIDPGMYCAVEPYLNCGRCKPCDLGRTNCCESLQVLGVHTDGGMRERIVVPVEKLHKSNTLALEQLALVETLSIGAHAVQRAELASRERVLIVGAGPIGLGALVFAQLFGAHVVVMDVNQQRLDFCQQNFKVNSTVRVGDTALDEVKDYCNGLPTAVFDATGHLGAMESSFDYVASAGRLIYIGFQRERVSFPNPEFHRREISIHSSRNSVSEDFRKIIRWMEEGAIDTNPWITHSLQFDNIVGKFPALNNPGERVLKAILEV
tara:strand:- start:605 stop:1618 length:1014 start_codon:yes stop_codon:yes gene_type:complete